jgi:periplasmic divalent cation tolerance protein
MHTQLLLVITSCPNQDSATELASVLVQQRLAACVQLVPGVTSLYHWQGELCRENEVVLHIKCLAERFPELEQKLLELHPYSVPELIALPVTSVAASYLDWIKDTTQA